MPPASLCRPNSPSALPPSTSHQVDVLVFGHLLQGRFPTLWAHLSALEVDAASVTMHCAWTVSGEGGAVWACVCWKLRAVGGRSCLMPAPVWQECSCPCLPADAHALLQGSSAASSTRCRSTPRCGVRPWLLQPVILGPGETAELPAHARPPAPSIRLPLPRSLQSGTCSSSRAARWCSSALRWRWWRFTTRRS